MKRLSSVALVALACCGCTQRQDEGLVLRGLSPEAARDEIRKLKAEGRFPDSGVTVELSGMYELRGRPFVLERGDGGTGPRARVKYRADKAGAVFTGACRIPRCALTAVKDPAVLRRIRPDARGRVFSCRLEPFGLASLPPLPDVIHAWNGLEVFCGDEVRTLARYPDTGWLTFGHEDVVDRGVKADRARGEWLFGCRGGTFRYSADDDRPANWDLSKGVFAHGFWCNDWASDSLKLGKIDPEDRTITTKGWHYLGIGPRSAAEKQPRRYFVYNLLEELDAPGEWYVDREAMVLYYYPKEGETADISVVWNVPPLIEIRGADYVTLEGISFTRTTGPALRAKDCGFLTLDGVSVSYVTRTGLEVLGGSNGLFRALKVSHTGGVGFRLTGGNREKLIRAGHRVTGCDLSRSGRIVSNAACLNFDGCGIRVDHNYIHDAPYTTVAYKGNDHLIEFNEIAFAMMESGDGGGLYTGRDWTSQGNVVRWNYLHHFGASGAAYKKKNGIALFCEPLKHDDSSGLYLDDCDSGDTCVSNIFYKVGRGVLVGGGRDNLVMGNLIVGCARCAVSVDARGLTRLRLGDGTKDGWDMIPKLEKVRYREEPWKSRYPLMADYLTNERLMPIRTRVIDNIAVACTEFTGSGWCKEHGFFVKKLVFSGNVSVGPRSVRDNKLYPEREAGSENRCGFSRIEELERYAVDCDDARELVKSELMKKHFPRVCGLPIGEMGIRQAP